MRIAITGGIAEGKSTVMGYLRDLGEATASADEIAKEVFASDDIQQKLARLLVATCPVEPALVRDRIAAEPLFRRKINALMHPQILSHIESSHATWVEVPLLFETCLQAVFDRVWVVTCGSEIQLERLADRLKNEDLARQMLATQLPTEAKLVFADNVVRTNLPDSVVLGYVKQAVQREIGK